MPSPGVDDPADGLDPTCAFVDGPVIELQLYFGHFADCFIGRSVLTEQVAKLVFAHGKIDVHLSGVRHRCQRLGNGRADQRSGSERECSYNTVGGGMNLGIGQVVSRVGFLRSGLF